MKVSAHNVALAYDELASAVERGEEVEISYENRPAIHLVPAPGTRAPKLTMNDMFGMWVGKGWVSPDFNSPELNKEIEDEFLNGPVFPEPAR